MYKYLTKYELAMINRDAINKGRNRTLDTDFINELPEDLVYPVIFSMVHNNCEIRARIVFNRAGQTGFLDMSFEQFEQLGESEVSQI
jgi:hypothetical protein